jgi:hypothetical protein
MRPPQESGVAEELDLAALQRWMQRAILASDGPDDAVDQLFTASATQTAQQRFAVYWRGYRLRLLENMRGLHPGLVHLLGRELFDQFALDYLDATPSRSYSLCHLDEEFADYLEKTRPDAGLPADEREPWPDLMVDMARFERTFTDVLDGPDSVRLLEIRFPVHTYVTAVRRGADPPLPPPKPTFLCLRRDGGVVRALELTADSYRALRTPRRPPQERTA